MVDKHFYNELEKIAKLSDKQKKTGLYLGSSILSGLLMHRGYRHIFPKVPAKGPMHSIHQVLTNEGRDIYTIGNRFVTDSKSRQRVRELAKNMKSEKWSSKQKVGSFPLVRLYPSKNGVWTALVQSNTKDTAGR